MGHNQSRGESAQLRCTRPRGHRARRVGDLRADTEDQDPWEAPIPGPNLAAPTTNHPFPHSFAEHPGSVIEVRGSPIQPSDDTQLPVRRRSQAAPSPLGPSPLAARPDPGANRPKGSAGLGGRVPACRPFLGDGAGPGSAISLQDLGTAADTSSPVQTIDISGNGPLDATVYAANAKLRVKGGGANGQVSGAVVANNLSLVGGSKFHYDEALADTTAGNPYGLGAWRKLTTARPARPMPAIWPSPCPRHPHPINRGGHRPAETTTDPSALIRTPQSPFRNKTVLGFGAVSRILFLPLTRDSVVISLGPLRTRPPSIACATAAGCDIPAAMGRATQPPILPCTGWGFSCRRHC